MVNALYPALDSCAIGVLHKVQASTVYLYVLLQRSNLPKINNSSKNVIQLWKITILQLVIVTKKR
jgi:hypothetical protein